MEGSLRLANRAEAAIARSAHAIAIIETDAARGMGFVVDPTGYLITNRHVIEDADHIEGVVLPARDPSRVFGSVRVVYIDPERDLALLQVHSDEPLPALPLATDDDAPVSSYLAASDPVVLVQRQAQGQDGAPTLALQRGEVSSLDVENPLAGPGSFVGVTADVRQGQSGGPVLDRHGRAVGVVTWTWRDRSGGYAIPIAEATRMLAERPSLEGPAQQRARADLRVRVLLDALARGDGPTARRLMAPTQARKLREDAVGRILADVQQGDGLTIMQSFVDALDEVAADAERMDDPSLASAALGPLVVDLASSNIQRFVGQGLAKGQLISFFQELGGAYLQARVIVGQDGAHAMKSALQRLQTIDAARSFALADLVESLRGATPTVRSVDLVPGGYALGARVELQMDAAAGDRPAERVDLHLRLEWGDFYVTKAVRTGIMSAGQG